MQSVEFAPDNLLFFGRKFVDFLDEFGEAHIGKLAEATA
jgi:hypothetical protein